MEEIMINNKEYVDYSGFKCLQITNGTVKCLVTVDAGPRIIYYGFDKNILFVDKNREICMDGEFFDKNFKKGEKFYFYGGHRLWKSEEDLYTYNCDNYPVEVNPTAFGASFLCGVQKCTNLQFELTVNMNEDGSLIVTHKITNKDLKPKNIAAWGITMLAAGGTQILPMPNEKTGFLHNRTLSIWDYTDLADKRLNFIGKYMKIKQLKNSKTALKLGTKNTAGFGLFVLDDLLFTKKADYQSGKLYPDSNCNFEAYTNNKFIEMESLSPLETLEQNQTLVHTEYWNIKKIEERFGLETESEIDEFVKRYVKY